MHWSEKSGVLYTSTIMVQPYYPEYTYKLNVYGLGDYQMTDSQLKLTNLDPAHKASLYTIGTYYEDSYGDTQLTISLSPNIILKRTSSSITVKGTYTKGDAEVLDQMLSFGNLGINRDDNYADGKEYKVNGLDPNKSFGESEYYVYYLNRENKRKYMYTNCKISTLPLIFNTLQPKVITPGNVIVAAEANVDDEEVNVGFEWRRTDWEDDFASNTGTAAVYEGTMEGYIRNLNTDKIYRFRPYYLSNSGTYYYGDWVGIDPTNTSYFEPTVHTYAKIEVEGNTALVKGYALRGTDNVTVQGFMYWKDANQAKATLAPRKVTEIPDDAMTVKATGQTMTATLKNLDYESTYSYVAFVTTSEGETFYGDVRSFTTGADLTGIENVEVSTQEQATEVARYNMNGYRITSPQRGINIVRMSDGTVRKVMVK